MLAYVVERDFKIGTQERERWRERERERDGEIERERWTDREGERGRKCLKIINFF